LAHPQYRVVRTPPTDVVDGVRDLWQRTRRRANVLMVMDVSESMGTPVMGSGKSRLALAQIAADVVPGQLATGDQIALWEFSSEIAKDAHPWRPLLPFGTASDVADAFEGKVASMQPLGQTALYATTRSAVSFVDSQFDPRRINAIVLLSDGHNEYPADDDLPRLLQDLQQMQKDHPVRVFTIAYGSEADAASLEQISQATRARSYTASDATQIQDVMLDVLSNF
jgi:Ca-activated chloride channel homolog